MTVKNKFIHARKRVLALLSIVALFIVCSGCGSNAKKPPIGVGFAAAGEGRSVIFKFVDIDEPVRILFGDDYVFSIEPNGEGYFDENSLFELRLGDSRMDLKNAELVVSESALFVAFDIPEEYAGYDWDAIGANNFQIIPFGDAKSAVELSGGDAVIPMSEMRAEFNEARTIILAARFSPPEILPENGSPFELPDGFETHSGDSAYFYAQTDDYIVVKHDGGFGGWSAVLAGYGKVDRYFAYLFREGEEYAYDGFNKWVFESHSAAIGCAAARGSDGWIIVENVIYPDAGRRMVLSDTTKEEASDWAINTVAAEYGGIYYISK